MNKFLKNRNKLLKKQGLVANKKKAIKIINFLMDTKYVYHFDWFGIPIIQFPSDIIVLQELIYKVKPNVIIECGIGHGGSLIFYSSLLKLIKKKFKIIGIDIKIGKNIKKIKKHFLSENISLIEKSSTSTELIPKIKKMIGNSKNILVILDSNHSEEHVYNELNLYSKFISKNNYLVVLDTVVEFVKKKHINRARNFSKGNSPYTAVKKFLMKNKNFKVDKYFENKALITSAYNGFLKKVK